MRLHNKMNAARIVVITAVIILFQSRPFIMKLFANPKWKAKGYLSTLCYCGIRRRNPDDGPKVTHMRVFSFSSVYHRFITEWS